MVRADDSLMRQMRTYQLGRFVGGSCFAQLMGGGGGVGGEYIKAEFYVWRTGVIQLLYTTNRKRRLPRETTQRF